MALLLHTWTYADFLEDPFTWAILAIGVALARREGRAATAEGDSPRQRGERTPALGGAD
jgi:hypothetical protein